ncbi:neuropeptide S receptor [Macaca fascicularis]|uniref:neuropeptide S receptor n=1 Tax=Macaca fascicularis TaxID=9541 RepID=UPI003D156F4F
MASSTNSSTRDQNLPPGVEMKRESSLVHPSQDMGQGYGSLFSCLKLKLLIGGEAHRRVVLLYASTYVLVSLSIDRYHAIVYPMKFLQGAKVLIVIAWSLSFLFSIPTLIIFGKRTLSNGEVQCWALWPDDSYWTPYMTIVAFLVYFIPFICCWSPYFLFDILDNFNLLPDTQERFYASVIIQNLPALNSAINPLIYCVFSSSISFPCG